MALDARLPLGVQGVDTTQAVPGMQDAQNNALAQIKQKYDNATTAEKYDVFSTGLGAATVTELAKTNPDAIVPFLEQRLQNIEGRVKQGLASDSNDTKMLLDTFRQNPEQGLAMAQGYLRTAQLTGAFDGLKKSDGGDTGVIMDRLKAAAEGRGMAIDDIEALEILKGGAGQAGKNAADIATGRQANFETSFGSGEGSKEGAAQGEANASFADFEAALPTLELTADKLYKLADTATYTKMGRGKNAFIREFGFDPGDEAAARAAYENTVKVEILPLLKPTFGAAFSIKEGEWLLSTLGDSNLSGPEKKAAIDARVQGWINMAGTLARRTGQEAPTGLFENTEFSQRQNPGMTLPGANTAPTADYTNMSDDELLRALQ